MEIQEKTQTARTFTLTVNADELAVIAHGMLLDASDTKSNDVKNYEVWTKLDDFMNEEEIPKIDGE